MGVHVINKEDRLRWAMQDKMAEIQAATGTTRPKVKLQRAHSCIGPFPGCRRLTELSPRKSSAVAFLEQKLLRSSCADPSSPTVREKLYEGVSHEEEGKHQYLKMRARQPLKHRYGSMPPTTAMEIGLNRPEDEYRASKFCHQPVMEAGFYRVNGVVTYANLPEVRK